MENHKVVEDIRTQFQCPKCIDYITPPILQCQNGHIICKNCLLGSVMCWICENYMFCMFNVRCLVLENIHSLITFPCRYKSNGCDFEALGKDIGYHQKRCAFSYVRTFCPFTYKCKWFVSKSQLTDHCTVTHNAQIFFNHIQLLTLSDVTTPSSRHYHTFFFHNHNFRCTWELNKEKGEFRLVVYCLQKSEGYSKFRYLVTVCRSNGETEILQFSRTTSCYFMDDDSEMFLNYDLDYVTVPYDHIKYWCDRDGADKLNYSVCIFRSKCD